MVIRAEQDKRMVERANRMADEMFPPTSLKKKVWIGIGIGGLLVASVAVFAWSLGALIEKIMQG